MKNKFLENIKRTYSKKDNLLKFNLILSGSLLLILHILLTWGFFLNPITFFKVNGFVFSFFSYLLVILISLATGINLTFLKIKYLKTKKLGTEKSSVLVFLLSFFGTGCPVCGSLILGLFGVPLGLTFLPFKGLEINFLTLILLIFSAYYISKKLDSCENCKVKSNKKNKKWKK